MYPHGIVRLFQFFFFVFVFFRFLFLKPLMG